MAPAPRDFLRKSMKRRPSRTAAQYEEASRAPSTRKAYLLDQTYFIQAGGSLPATEDAVIDWLVVASRDLSLATIRRRLVAIHAWHKDRNMPSPATSVRVKRVLAGISRTIGAPQRAVSPLEKDALIAVLTAIQDQHPVAVARDRALLLLQFAAALRRSNLVEVRVEHLLPHDYGMDVFLPRSKTDQLGAGTTITVPYAAGEFCPVQAVAYWFAVSGIESGHVFRAVDRHGNVSDDKLDLGSVCRIVKRAVAAAGLDASAYSSHSARAGFISTAAAMGRPAHEIALTSQHKGIASMQRYMRVADRRRVRSIL
jgi:integrase